MSASVAAEKLIPRHDRLPLTNITSLCFSCTLTCIVKYSQKQRRYVYIFFSLPVRRSVCQSNSRSVGHAGSAACSYRNDCTTHALALMSCWSNYGACAPELEPTHFDRQFEEISTQCKTCVLFIVHVIMS